MKRHEWLLAGLGIVLLAIGAGLIGSVPRRTHDIVLTEACRTPVRILDPAGRAVGSAVVFHGLSANRRLMQALGQWLAEAGLQVFLLDSPGHGDSIEPFSLGRTEQCAAAAADWLARRGAIAADRTVLVGHSMGGAVVLRLADRFPDAATIAISPAPTNLPHRLPANLLVLGAQFDLPPLREAAEKLLRAAGGERFRTADFQQRRAVRWELIPGATHTSLIFDPRVGRAAASWALKALGAPGTAPAPPARPLAGAAVGLAGLFLMFPLAASGLATAFRAGRREEGGHAAPSARVILGMWTIASLFAAGLLNLWVPLRFLRLLGGDYLASLLLVCGLVLLALLRREAKGGLHLEAWALAVALGLGSILGFGAWLNWRITDAWLNLPRVLRFVPLIALTLPYFLAEEVVLGPPGSARRLQRFVLFLALRLIPWLAMLFALFLFNSGEILVLLLALYLTATSLVQRWGSDGLRGRTGSPAVAALFGAILAAWFLAAVFPLT